MEATVPTLTIVTLGDSTTAHASDWAPEIVQVYSDCLPERLARLGIVVTVFNAGIGDTSTRDAVRRLDSDVRARHPNIVVIQFGINDSWIDADKGRTQPRLHRAEYRANLSWLIRTLRRDGAAVILMTPNPMRWAAPYYIKAFEEHPGLLDTRDPRGIDKLLDQYAQAAREVAKAEDVDLVDVHEAFEAYGQQPGQSVTDILLAGDGIHPNQAGQDLVCSILTPKIAEMVQPHD